MRIKIDNEIYNVSKVQDYGTLPIIETDEGDEFYLAKDTEEAGEKAKEYWSDMAEHDPKEFACIVGEETLVQWGLGRNAGPGSVGCDGLEDWLDLTASCPEEHFASYDGMEREVQRVGELVKELGFVPTVAYRHN